MPAEGLRFKDCIVAPNSELGQLIQDKKWGAAEKHYQKLEAKFKQHVSNEQLAKLGLYPYEERARADEEWRTQMLLKKRKENGL